MLTESARAIARLERADFHRVWATLTPDERAIVRLEVDRRYVRVEDLTPLDLALRLDISFVPTMALRVFSDEMVAVRDALDLMYERRVLHASLVRKGVNERKAIEQVTAETEDRGCRRLILNMPPQEGKSTLITVYGTLWLYRQFPGMNVTLVSYDGQNAERLSYNMRQAITTYDGVNEDVDLGLRLARNQKAISRWRLRSQGTMYAVGIRGGLTGRPSDYMPIDDPVKDQAEAESELISQQNWAWWTTTGRTRLAPWAPVVALSTRWHELDLIGRFRLQQKEDQDLGRLHYDDWRLVNIPAQADHDPSAGEVDILDRVPGQFMVSARGRSDAEWEATKAVTPDREWNSLFQGRPGSIEGDVLKAQWWHYYEDVLVQPQLDGSFRVPGYTITQSWDLTFDRGRNSDYVVGQVWARRDADSFLLYEVCARMGFTQQLDAIKRVRRLFPLTQAIYVERAANGAALIATLRKDVPGIIGIKPKDSKRARAEAASVYLRAGNFWLPSNDVVMEFRELAFDVKAFVAEMTAFDHGAHDDRVDAWSQYARETYVVGSSGKFLSPVGVRGRATVRPTTERQVTPLEARLLKKGRK